MLPLEFDGDRLDERIVLERVLDPAPDRLDQLEELVRFVLLLVGKEGVRKDIVIAFVEFVEMHACAPVGDLLDRQYTFGRFGGPP